MEFQDINTLTLEEAKKELEQVQGKINYLNNHIKEYEAKQAEASQQFDKIFMGIIIAFLIFGAGGWFVARWKALIAVIVIFVIVIAVAYFGSDSHKYDEGYRIGWLKELQEYENRLIKLQERIKELEA